MTLGFTKDRTLTKDRKDVKLCTAFFKRQNQHWDPVLQVLAATGLVLFGNQVKQHKLQNTQDANNLGFECLS
jgi:hypothetical protein